jgi:hypothetical protein
VERSLVEELELRVRARPLPRHVAIIMDGNGRWAEARGLPRVAGHRAGADAVRAVTRTARRIGVQALTLYAKLCNVSRVEAANLYCEPPLQTVTFPMLSKPKRARPLSVRRRAVLTGTEG